MVDVTKQKRICAFSYLSKKCISNKWRYYALKMTKNVVLSMIVLALAASIVYILSIRNKSEIKFESFELMEKREVEGFG